jgi:putative hemolysin
VPYVGEEFAVLIVTVFVLFFSEITPKVLFSIFADDIILFLMPIIRGFEIIVKPVSYIAEWITAKLVRLKQSEMNDVFSHHEIDHIFAESKRGGIVEFDEHKYIKNIFLLKATRVKEIMIPRADIMGLELQSSVSDAYKEFELLAYSRLPVYSETMDNIEGVLFAKDLITKPKQLADIIQPALFVPETKSCKELLIEMQEANRTIAFAVDEFGGLAGMIRIEQLIAVIVGSIDEGEQHTTLRHIFRLSETQCKVAGRLEKEILEEEMDISLPDGDYETVAGLVLNRLMRFPEKGEIIDFDGFSFEILSLDQKQITWILVELQNND